MARELNGRELADFIKERQQRTVGSLNAVTGAHPKLAIVQVKDDPVINTYVKLKKRYGNDIGVEVVDHRVQQSKALSVIAELNDDPSVSGIIVQLPLEDISETDTIVNAVAPEKDVDALAKQTNFSPATPIAILWLLAGYNVDLKTKKVLIIGKGRLVGAPLYKMLKHSKIDVSVADQSTKDLKAKSLAADVIISATGKPYVLSSDMVKEGSVVVDAGVASESGKLLGDLNPDIYQRDDLIITPEKGGVGPLTVCSLFENVITAVQNIT